MYRKLIALLFFGASIVLAISLSGWKPTSPFNIDFVGFEAVLPQQTNEFSCSNNSLIGTLALRFSLELKRTILEYSSMHENFLQRVTHSQYLEYQKPNTFDHDVHRWRIHHTEFGHHYDGDILAIFDHEVRFVFFPANFSFDRFQRTLNPDKATEKVFASLFEELHSPDYSQYSILFYVVNEAHRLLLGLSSDLDKDNPHSKNCDDYGLCASLTEIPDSVIEFSAQFCNCLAQLTNKSTVLSYYGEWFVGRENLAVRKIIRTVYLALDQFRTYILMRPYEQKNYEFATILFNAILEVAGLPCLSIDFASEKWGGNAQRALDGDMEPLMVGVLNELIATLLRAPSTYS